MSGDSLTAVFEDSGLPLAQDLQEAVLGWLSHLEHERGQASKTVEAYARDHGLELAKRIPVDPFWCDVYARPR